MFAGGDDERGRAHADWSVALQQTAVASRALLFSIRKIAEMFSTGILRTGMRRIHAEHLGESLLSIQGVASP